MHKKNTLTTQELYTDSRILPHATHKPACHWVGCVSIYTENSHTYYVLEDIAGYLLVAHITDEQMIIPDILSEKTLCAYGQGVFQWQGGFLHCQQWHTIQIKPTPQFVFSNYTQTLSQHSNDHPTDSHTDSPIPCTPVFISKKQTIYKTHTVADNWEYIKHTTHQWFSQQGYATIRAPLLVPSGGLDPYLQPVSVVLESYYSHNKLTLQLPTSPELALKRLLSTGLLKFYAVATAVRNKDFSQTHQPEFTMLEWYTVGDAWQDCLEQTHAFVVYMAKHIGNTHIQNTIAHIQQPIQYTVDALLHRTIGTGLAALEAGWAHKTWVVSDPMVTNYSWDAYFSWVWIQYIEVWLKTQPMVFVTHFPLVQKSMSLETPNQAQCLFGKTCQRFELYMYGLEICNGYQENTDPHSLEFYTQQSMLQNPTLLADSPFIESAKQGWPLVVAGNALGLERLCSALTGNSVAQAYHFSWEGF
jgi:elongation factor P--beta-lysine ligase